MPSPVVVPAVPIGPLSSAWRECVGTGRLSLRPLQGQSLVGEGE